VPVDARGLHGLSCRKSAPRQQRHSHMNDIIWRAIKRTQVPAVKEPVSLTLEDNKRPYGTTLLPWAKGKPLAWDVTVPDTYAESRVADSDTVSTPGAAAHQAAQHKIAKYSKLASTHMFYPITIETAGTRDDMAIELVQEIGRRTTVITQDTRVFLFQHLSIALQRGNAVSFLNTMNTE